MRWSSRAASPSQTGPHSPLSVQDSIRLLLTTCAAFVHTSLKCRGEKVCVSRFPIVFIWLCSDQKGAMLSVHLMTTIWQNCVNVVTFVSWMCAPWCEASSLTYIFEHRPNESGWELSPCITQPLRHLSRISTTMIDGCVVAVSLGGNAIMHSWLTVLDTRWLLS